jgi:hypothetical protein
MYTTREVANISMSKQLYCIKPDLVFWYLALLQVHVHIREDAVLNSTAARPRRPSILPSVSLFVQLVEADTDTPPTRQQINGNQDDYYG